LRAKCPGRREKSPGTRYAGAILAGRCLAPAPNRGGFGAPFALRAAPVVIVSEPANNPGTSVTNAIEQIAAEVTDALTPTRVPVFIEHYPLESTGGCEETLDLVVFADYEVRDVMHGGIWRKEFGSPTWKPLGRCAVEVLVGGPM
jgi:hypothetical protein